MSNATITNGTVKPASQNRTARLLGLVVVLQALTLAGQWLGHDGPRMLPQAQAQLANPAAERGAMLDELKTTNSKLDRLASILESGQLQVKVVNPDERKDGKDGHAAATKDGASKDSGIAIKDTGRKATASAK